jgi:disease resistance protein RPM1
VAADLDGSVESLGNLNYLYINQATSLPTWISPAWLPLLSYLEIRIVQVRTDDIRVLGMLQALRVLRVHVSGEVQVLERFAVNTDAFPCAIKFSFFGFSMAPWAFPHGAMPRLEEFHFPMRLEDFTSAKFAGVSEGVVMEVEEKLRHEADGHPNKPNIGFEDYYY